jgi:sugar lactone lactonase YvrE
VIRKTDAEVRVAVATPALLGESPVWHPHEQVLYYCDIPQHQLLRFNPQTDELRQWNFDTDIASFAPMQNGQLLLAMRDGLWCFDPQTGALTRRVVEPPYSTDKERFNDGKCDPQGRFWVGTLYEPRDAELAALYCFSANRLEKKFSGVTALNGLAWSPDARTIYWSDTKAHTVYAATYESQNGQLTGPRTFASFAPRNPQQPLANYGGRPDGAAIDAEGCYWVAMFEGQRLVRLSPRGEVICEVRLPVRCPTMPCFGGPHLKTLYVTTSRQSRPIDELQEQPHAGCVLALEVDVEGLPVSFVQPLVK